MVPSGSDEAEPLTPTSSRLTVLVNDAVGAWLPPAATVTLRLVVPVAPPLSVTVRVIVYVPAAA